MSRDPAQLEQNLYQYATSNPVNYADQTGLLSVSPIEAMIQVHYQNNFAVGIPEFEFSIPQGSKEGLELDTTGHIPHLVGTPNLNIGFADIVDIVQPGGAGLAYEIKPQRLAQLAVAEINWYVTVYNSKPKPYPNPRILVHGTNYPRAWEVIGINPYSHESQLLLARQENMGVIVWRGVKFDDPRIPLPLPRYIYEWDEQSRQVKQKEVRRLAPAPVPFACQIDPETLGKVGWTTLVIGTGTYIVWNLKGCIFGPAGCVVDLVTPGI